MQNSQKKSLLKGQYRVYSSNAHHASFLLGGIGTGNISLGSRGELRDWEIMNNPGKGNNLPYSFFSIRVQQGEKVSAKVLEARPNPEFDGVKNVPGLPRFDASSLSVSYPFATVAFEDSEIPVKVILEAFTPFVPLDPEASGIPAAIFRYKVINSTSRPADVSISGSITNPVGFRGIDPYGALGGSDYEHVVNEVRDINGYQGIHMYSNKFDARSPYYGSASLVSSGAGTCTVKPYWLKGSYWDGVQDYWDDFCADGSLEAESKFDAVDCLFAVKSNIRTGAVCRKATIEPGNEAVFEFIISWYFPNRIKKWVENTHDPELRKPDVPIVRNHYALNFEDSWDVIKHLSLNLDKLESLSRSFTQALYSNTIPEYVIEALTVGITVIRSNTCFWLENGKFLGWEGCGDKSGNCFGNCTHVWNYAQTLAFLFPSLERSMRQIEFLDEIDEKGRLSFRMKTVFDQKPWDFTHPAVDGQLGTIIRFYRDWKLSGDTDFFNRLYDNVMRAMDYSLEYWDSDGDCLPDTMQHNTYDIEFYGANSLSAPLMLGALKACIEMAEYKGDHTRAEKLKETFARASESCERLWNGEYYIQELDNVDKYKYQYGDGCLSDQLIGQFLSHVAGLGYTLPEDRIKKASKSVFDYNFRRSFANHHNVQRSYVFSDESGLLSCSWPHGGRPKIPYVYSDEVWTGIEYMAAAQMIYEGLVDEGLAVAKAVRDRHDGYRRNPWNENEAGHHYARSASGWALLTALSGFKCDIPGKKVSFAPQINQMNFKTFWSTGTAWGTYTQKVDPETWLMKYDVEVLYGSLGDVEVHPPCEGAVRL